MLPSGGKIKGSSWQLQTIFEFFLSLRRREARKLKAVFMLDVSQQRTGVGKEMSVMGPGRLM